MTPASLQALDGLRDLSTLKWYVIPLLAIVFYIYVAALLVIGMPTMRAKVMTVASLYGIAIVANAVAMGLLGWRY